MEAQTIDRPSDSPLAAYLTDAEAAAVLNRTRRALSGWRRAGHGPAWVKIGPTVLYPKDGLKAWLEAITVDPNRRGRRPA
jgi:hypothetical protein